MRRCCAKLLYFDSLFGSSFRLSNRQADRHPFTFSFCDAVRSKWLILNSILRPDWFMRAKDLARRRASLSPHPSMHPRRSRMVPWRTPMRCWAVRSPDTSTRAMPILRLRLWSRRSWRWRAGSPPVPTPAAWPRCTPPCWPASFLRDRPFLPHGIYMARPWICWSCSSDSLISRP